MAPSLAAAVAAAAAKAPAPAPATPAAAAAAGPTDLDVSDDDVYEALSTVLEHEPSFQLVVDRGGRAWSRGMSIACGGATCHGKP
eukprot:366577-Chlamydomonas_euryale.AAC.6